LSGSRCGAGTSISKEGAALEASSRARGREHRRLGAHIALALGTLLVGVACLLCTALVFLEPQPPWHDVEAQQAQWIATSERLIATAMALLVAATPLFAYAFVAWRIARRAKHRRLAALGRTDPDASTAPP
jgi:heme A synthase